MAKELSLLDQANAVAAEVQPPSEGEGAPQIATRKINVPASRLAEFAALISSTYPDATLNENAIRKGGTNAQGKPNCVFAVVQKNPTGTAAVYHTGKAFVTGVMADIDW